MATTITNRPTPAGETSAATDFVALSERLAADAPTWRAAFLRRSSETFARLGLPKRKHEDWRYTSLAPLIRGVFEPLWTAPASFDRDALRRAFVGGEDVLRLVFVDGHFDADLSNLADPGRARIGELDASLRTDAALAARFGEGVAGYDDGVAALAGAFLRQGALVHLPRGTTLERTVQIVHAIGAERSSSPAAARVVAPRSLIVLEEGARARIVETYVALGSGPDLALPVAEIFLGPAAHLEHQRLQLGSVGSLHLGTTQAQLGRGAVLESGFYSFGGALARDRVGIELAGEGAECNLRGLYTARGEEHADCDLLVDHQVPHGTSRQEYRGLLSGRGQGTFHGRVIVRPGAQKAEARQSSRNLLLSRDARAQTRPQLEIFADDVQCSHGATIGQLDPAALFYLRSRGLDEDVSRSMLAHGFANEVVLGLGWVPLRERIERELDRFLGDGAAAPSEPAR